MKTIFIPVKYTGKVDLTKIELNKLPKKIGIITTAQFLGTLKEIQEYLEKNNKTVLIGKDKQKNPGQVLGCDVSAAAKTQDKVDAFLYIGSGEFHPIGVALKTGKEVFIFNPATGTFSKLDNSKIENYKKDKKVRYTNFLHSDNIGILVSTKPGQCSYKKAVEIKNKLEGKGKKCFIFVFDTLNANEMENFPFVDFWVNTACPRIAGDEDKKNVIDMSDIDF
jgi:2-(3-amino-3-carboxypropyl)histidine synthase